MRQGIHLHFRQIDHAAEAEPASLSQLRVSLGVPSPGSPEPGTPGQLLLSTPGKRGDRASQQITGQPRGPDSAPPGWSKIDLATGQGSPSRADRVRGLHTP